MIKVSFHSPKTLLVTLNSFQGLIRLSTLAIQLVMLKRVQHDE